MKRAVPQKVKPVSCQPNTTDVMVGQTAKQALPRAQRRARTSAAMIGLALSMGASSLLIPRQDDGAAAAEPRTTESTASANSRAFYIASLPSTSGVEVDAGMLSSSATATEHVVQQGQTLWQIARRYQVGVEAIASANGLTPDATLRVGQAIRIPASSTRTENHVRTSPSSPSVPESTGVSSVRSPQLVASSELRSLPEIEQVEAPVRVDSEIDDALKAQQDEAVAHLRERRDALKNSLAELRSEELSTSAVVEGANPVAEPLAQLEESVIRDTSGVDVRSTTVEPKDIGTIEQVASPQAIEPQVVESQAVEPQISEPQAAELQAAEPQISEPQVVKPQVAAQVEEPQVPEMSASIAHQVKPGETLVAIARTYQVQPQVLADANQLDDPNRLQVNQTLAIPQLQASAPESFAVSVLPEPMLPEQSAVPTLNAPAPDASVSLPSVVVDTEEVEASASLYQINGGDTIAQIARTHQVSITALVEANGLSDPNLIVAGQELRIPTSPELIVDRPRVEVPTVIGLQAEQAVPEEVVNVPVVPAAIEEETAMSIPTAESLSFGGSEVPEFDQTVVVAQNAKSELTAAASAPEGENNPTRTSSNQYVEGLMSEILTLRNQYQGDARATNPSVTVAAAPSYSPATESSQTSEAVNPEFNPDRYAETIRARAQQIREDQQTQQAAVQVPTQVQTQVQTPVEAPASQPEESPQLVAVAPLGSENYQPLTQPITGRMVSPELPPLPGAEAYLPESTQPSNGLIWPARGVFTSGYGWRWGRMHRGIDIGAPTGTPVVAAASGVVQFSGWNSGGYGNMVEIRHPDGSMTRYAHHSRNLVSSGQQVEQGQQIAQVGSTGYSTGPHLHFEVHLPAQGTVNPMAYLPSR